MKKHVPILWLALCGLFSVGVGKAQTSIAGAELAACLRDGRSEDALEVVERELAERPADIEWLDYRFTLLESLGRLEAAIEAGEAIRKVTEDEVKEMMLRLRIESLRKRAGAGDDAKEAGDAGDVEVADAKAPAADRGIEAVVADLARARKDRDGVAFDKILRKLPKAFETHPVLLLARAEQLGSLGSKFHDRNAIATLERLVTALAGDVEPGCAQTFDLYMSRQNSDLTDLRRIANEHRAVLNRGDELFVLTPTAAIERQLRLVRSEIETRELNRDKNRKELAEARQSQRNGDKRHSDLLRVKIRDLEKLIEQSDAMLKPLRQREASLAKGLEDRGPR